MKTETEIILRANLLEYIRAGNNSKATEFLQTMLDSDMLTLDFLVKEGTPIGPKTIQALSKEHSARLEARYEPSDPAVRTAVSDLFSRVLDKRDHSAQPIIPPDLSRQAAPVR